MLGFKEASEEMIEYALGCIQGLYGPGGKSPKAYHNVDHTNSAITSARLISRSMKLPHKDTLLISIAAAFHDIVHDGDSNPNNELLSADEASKEMKRYPVFTDDDISRVRQMILATNCTAKYPKIVQTPAEDDTCSMILCDADLSSFGKPYGEFLKTSDCYFEELYPENDKDSDQYMSYLQAEIVILNNHEFWTFEASNLFPNRSQNIQKLLELVK